MTVPVTVQVLDQRSADDIGTLDDWDQVNECSLNVATGCIVVAGTTDYFPDAAQPFHRVGIAPESVTGG